MKSYGIQCLRLLPLVAAVGLGAGCGDSDDEEADAPTTITVTAPADTPPADNPPALAKSELYGTWAAPGEVVGADTVTYSFALTANDEALFSEETMTGQVGSVMSVGGTWDLSGTTLILQSSVAAMNGNGTVVGKVQVTINGRTFNKQ